MNRYRIASIASIVVALAFLAGCGSTPSTTWHSPSSGGTGGGSEEPVSALVSVRHDASGVRGVQATTESAGVALTFDDGPDPTWTPRILALLKKNDVKATFCVVGIQVQQFPQL